MGTSTLGWRVAGGALACVVACGGAVSRVPGDAASGSPSALGGSSSVGGTDEGVDEPTPATGTTGGKKPVGGGQGGMPNSAGTPGVSTGGKRPVGGAGVGPNGCFGNQILLNGVCACPAYAPTYCEAAQRCVNASKDPDHCGDCDTQCGATNACSAGLCTPDLESVTTLTGCGSLLLDWLPGTVYALGTSSGKLTTINASGTVSLLASGLTGAVAFALDSLNAYVAVGSTVVQISLSSGAKTVLVTEASPVRDVAIFVGKIYYATGQFIKQADATTPGVGTPVAKSSDEGEAAGVAVTGEQVVYLSDLSFNVETDPIVGEQHVKLSGSQGSLLFGHRGVQVDATHAYWANGALSRIAILGEGNLSTTAAQPIDGEMINAFAIDVGAQTAYFSTMDGRFEKSTFQAAQAGNEATWIARSLTKVTSVVLDESKVYLAAGCQILKTPL